jgi:hypothetical protein
MSRIRVALGDVQSAMLRDILSRITELEPDMELVGHVTQPNLKDDVTALASDVVICDVPTEQVPDVCRELFSADDPPIVVGLLREGREALVAIANAGAAQLMSVIRSAVLREGDGKVLEMVRPADADRPGESSGPYATNAECLNDQLRALDLALLAELETLETTVWDDNVQRLQGLAISPEEVRSLLQGPSTPRRQNDDLRRRRLRLAEWIAKRIKASARSADAPPFVRLVDRLELGPFEQFCIASVLAFEVDRNKYGKAYALLQDDVTRKQPALELLLRLHEGTADVSRSDAARVFDPSRPFRRWNLIRFGSREPGEPAALLGRRIELDDRISRYLLGLSDLGSPLDEFATPDVWDLDTLRVSPPVDVEDRLVRLIDDIRKSAPGAPPRLVAHVRGRHGTGRRALVTAVCQRERLRLLRVDAVRLAAQPPAALDEALALLAREATLEPTALCVERIDALLEDEVASAAALRAVALASHQFAPVTFVIGQRPWAPESVLADGVFQIIDLPLPSRSAARRLWLDELADVQLGPEVGGPGRAANELAGRFSLSPGQIRDAAAAARTRGLWRRTNGPVLGLDDLYQACRGQCGHRLDALAQQVTTVFTWSDLVLPDNQRGQLEELELAIRNASGVLEDWNFQSRLPYGRGITALFAGPSGTGKTMAAGILARELGLDLYKIDLSRVVSKYIGETEKNLDRIFREAEAAHAMLFFDEADALFGKRSAIRDAHDRYANIEVAYLLQKMEEREGVTILASNLKTNMDDAFVRRIRFAVDFPMPEYAQRLEIWRRSLPAEIRLAGDVDLPLLAKRLRVTGGSIMNICVGAASLAYAPDGAIAMKHLLHAAKRELQKLGQQYNESEFAVAEFAGASLGRFRAGA